MRSAAFIFALLVVLAGPSAAVAAPATGGSTSPAVSTDESLHRLGAPDETRIVVALHQNRSARWSVTLRYRLETQNETAAFRQYATAFEQRQADVGLDVEMFRTIVDRASAATGRNMTVRNPAYRASLGESTGTLTLSFTWTNLLTRPDGDTLRFDDAVLLPHNRSWLSSLRAGQRMVIQTPDGYSVSDSPFGVENNSVVVSGPEQFDGRIDITYQRTANPIESPPWGLIVGGIVVAAAILAGALLYRRRRRIPSTTDGGTAATTASVDAPPPSDDAPPEDSAPSDGGVGATADAENGDGGVDLELLSDEERVERLLEQNGGRMKQANIVRETGWSDAKVSQLLSAMADDGRIDKLRLGRENLISLPEAEEE